MATPKKSKLTKATIDKTDITSLKDNVFNLKSVWVHSLFTDFDISLFLSGKHFRLYEKMGAHLCIVNKIKGTYFAVWAPNAQKVAVMANFNAWNRTSHLLNK